MNIGPRLNPEDTVYVLINADEYATGHRSLAYDDALDNLDIFVDAASDVHEPSQGWWPALLEIPRADLGMNQWGRYNTEFSWTVRAADVAGRTRVAACCADGFDGDFLASKGQVRTDKDGKSVEVPVEGYLYDDVGCTREKLRAKGVTVE